MKKLGDTLRRLLSASLNLFIVCAEPIALPISWSLGRESMFTFYTENANMFAAMVCALVAAGQLRCIFTGRELPLWLKRLKYIATSCLLLTLLTVIFVLAPAWGPDGLYVGLCTGSMLYHHLLNPLAALASLLLLERSPRLPRSTVRWALLPTVIYGAVLIGLNILGAVDGPYFFLQVRHQSALSSVLWCAAILALDYSCAWLLWKLGGNRKKKVKKPKIVIKG